VINTFTVGQGGGHPLLYNCLQLKGAIAEAKEACNSIVKAGTGNDILPNKFWAEPTHWDPVNNWITEGERLIGLYENQMASDQNEKSTNQASIDAAVSNLQSATNTLRFNRNSGCKPDYNQLIEGIDDAQDDLDATHESLDGHEWASTDPIFWARPGDRAALQALINASSGHVASNDLATHNNYSANQNEVDAVYADLSAARTAFLGLRTSGGDAYDSGNPDYINMLTLIQTVDHLLDTNSDNTPDVVSSANSGTDIPYGTQWIAINEYTSLMTYLDDAREIRNSGPTEFTQTRITNTYALLSNAHTAVVAGNYPKQGLAANKEELVADIAAAQTKLTIDAGNSVVLHPTANGVPVVISPLGNGTDLTFGTVWVTQAMVNNLKAALSDALNAYHDIPTAVVLHNRITQLKGALQTHTAAFSPTKNAPANAQPDLVWLNAECDKIWAAVNVLKESSLNGIDVKATEMWVLTATKTALLQKITDSKMPGGTVTYTTHEDVMDRIDALEHELAALLATQQPGTKVIFILASQEDEQQRIVKEIPVAAFVGATCETPQLVNAGLPGVSYKIIDGALPDGLRLNASTTGQGNLSGYDGTLTGTPTDTGRFEFTIEAVHAMLPNAPELLKCAITIYDAPVTEPTEPDFVDANRISIQSDIVFHFPSAVPMNTDVTGTVVFNDQPLTGYWATDTTFIVPCPTGYYEYETNYTLRVRGLVSKDGYLRYERAYDFRTSSTPPNPTIPRSVTLLPLPYGVTSDKQPGQYWTTFAEGYRFTLTLTVPPDETPTLITDREIKDVTETVNGVPDPEVPDRYLFTVVQIHKAIEISVVLSPRSDVGNEWTAGGGEDVRIRTSGGRVYVESPVAGVLSVYSVTGVLQVQKNIAADSSTTLSLPKGIYIMRLNERTYKMAVQ
jgi:hypothetical protein